MLSVAVVTDIIKVKCQGILRKHAYLNILKKNLDKKF